MDLIFKTRKNQAQTFSASGNDELSTLISVKLSAIAAEVLEVGMFSASGFEYVTISRLMVRSVGKVEISVMAGASLSISSS